MMKKVFFIMAVAGMFGFAACNNNNKAAEEVADTTPAVEAVAQEVEEFVDSTAATVENAVEEVIDEVKAE